VGLPGELYFLTHLPVEMRLTDFLQVSGASLFATFLASLLPLARAFRVRPGVVLR
jgi:lipoprotein-releasing system permease protein